MALGLGMIGINTLPDEAAVSTVLKDKIQEPGLYFYPGITDPGKFQAALATQPRGILTYTPPATPYSFGHSLAVQFLFEVLGGLIAAGLISVARVNLRSIGYCVLFGALLGAFAWLAVDAPYWNWYGFGSVYTLRQLIDHVVGWSLGGLTLGVLLKPRPAWPV